MNDTIVAISTTMGVGAISIVRLSGSEAVSIVNKCFKLCLFQDIHLYHQYNL